MTDTPSVEESAATLFGAAEPKSRRRRGKEHLPQNESIQVIPTAGAVTAGSDQIFVLGISPSPSSNSTPHEDSLWDALKRPLTAGFLLALSGGVVVEIRGSTLIPVTLMVCYFIFGITRPKSLRNTERFADSLYYLGFILTLGALFLAMTPWFNSGDQLTSRTIIEKFGIAIATTFIGMTLRIILIQLRQTSSDQEEEARESIAQYVVALNSDISETISDLRRFRNDAVGNAAESAKEFGRQMVAISATSGDAVKESNKALLQSVQQVTASIDVSMQEVVRRLSQLEVPTDVFTTRLQSSADALSREIEQLRKSLSNGTGSFTASLAESVLAMGRIKGEIDNLQSAIASANRNVGQTAALSAETVAGTRRFAQTTSDAAASMQQFRLTAAELAGALTDLGSRLDTRGKEYQSGLAGVRDELKAAVADVRSNADDFSKTVIESVVVLSNAIKETRV